MLSNAELNASSLQLVTILIRYVLTKVNKQLLKLKAWLYIIKAPEWAGAVTLALTLIIQIQYSKRESVLYISQTFTMWQHLNVTNNLATFEKPHEKFRNTSSKFLL